MAAPCSSVTVPRRLPLPPCANTFPADHTTSRITTPRDRVIVPAPFMPEPLTDFLLDPCRRKRLARRRRCEITNEIPGGLVRRGVLKNCCNVRRVVLDVGWQRA